MARLRDDGLRRAAEAAVDGEVDDRGGHGTLPPEEIRILCSSSPSARLSLVLCALVLFVWGCFAP